MSVTKKVLAVIIALAVIISPFIFVIALTVALPPQYSDTFFGALNEKYDRLNSIEDDKIVVVGGSSVAFGLDSEQLEAYTGMPVVNFGLYADLGTKIMLDLSLSGISEGDLVILAPELDRQTLSLYFNNRSALSALDDDYTMMRHLPVGDIFSCLGAMYSFAFDKYSRYTSDTENMANTIYRADYFNEYGDFALERKENVMPSHYDPNTPVELNIKAYGEDFKDFCDYLNKYIKKCERRGATVCFSYCPINEMAISSESDKSAQYEFEEMLKKNIKCEFISVLDDYILEAGYFFDTNFHLNDSGVAVRTIRLAKDLRIAYGIMRGTLDSEPKAPALPFLDVMYNGEDDNSRFFTYEKLQNGAYAISGLTDEGRGMTELTIPLGVDGRKVTTILEHAFAGSSVRSVIIPKDANLVIINNGAFFGATELRELKIYKMSARDVMPPADFAGVHPSFVIHVPRGSAYADDYDWSNKAEYIYDL